ncbi:MAG: hypothetical protein VYB54_12620 [Pseudomonadota bacterium]|nr:hypothetical protein [Pseudomonadota bacterium]
MKALLLALALVAAALPALAEAWIEALDLPLAQGLSTGADDVTEFDSGAGRIVVVAAQGPVAAADVRRYYLDALPALGWQSRGEGRFVRAGERLDIDIVRSGGQTAVTFRLAPLD